VIGKTSHFFPLTFSYQNPYATGLESLFHIYQQALINADLSGPTYFAPTLKNVKNFQMQKANASKDSYTVLLILTDGCIHDMAETKKEIVEMSRMGISIIIVGVGVENFDMMHELDSDEHVSLKPDSSS